AKRIGNEQLTAFLVRQRLLSGPTARILELVAERNLTEIMASALIDLSELTRLRSRLPDLTLVSEEDELSATVTILAGNDTAEERSRCQSNRQLEKHPRVGMKLGRYVLNEWVGEGSCGIVFRALHPPLQIPVAVKVLRPAIDRQWCQ